MLIFATNRSLSFFCNPFSYIVCLVAEKYLGRLGKKQVSIVAVAFLKKKKLYHRMSNIYKIFKPSLLDFLTTGSSCNSFEHSYQVFSKKQIQVLFCCCGTVFLKVIY
jgi:hypothetical protein